MSTRFRVLDLTQAMAGPQCGMLLGDFGAEVIKIERPGPGDQARGWGPPFLKSESTYFLSTNRNKRSMTLNLDTAAGVEVLHELVRGADVFLVNQPSRASLQKRRMDWDSLREVNPRLVYCSITGYGFTGPKAEWPGYDLIAQGEAGLMSFTGDPSSDEPMKYPIPIADITTGVYAALGVLAALHARTSTGKGQFVDLALFDAQMTWLSHIGSDYLNAGAPARRMGNAHASIVPYQVFRARDAYMTIAVGSEALWKRFCGVLEITGTLGADPRFATNRSRNERRAELVPLLQEILVRKDAEHWLPLLQAADIPCGRINTVAQALDEPQARARGTVVELPHPTLGVARSVGNPVKLSDTPVTYRRPPPLLGEHTAEILRELGRTEGQIEALRSAGAI